MTNRRDSGYEAWREELFATTTPGERIAGNRMQHGTIYASAGEYSADMRAMLLDQGSSPEFAEAMAEDAERAWNEFHGGNVEP